MQIIFEQPVNMVHLAGVLACWCIVLWLMIRQYRKQQKKPVVWKMVIVVWVGLFAFNFHLPMFGQVAKLSILPLGVWILYLFFRKRSWDTYRRFAWLGFFANYLFLVITLLSGAAHQAIYNKRNPSTYLGYVRLRRLVLSTF